MEGRRTVLVPKTLPEAENAVTGVMKYLWWGYVLRCPRHGIVYRSRARWSGNPPPEDCPNVHWQVVHLWPGETSIIQVGSLLTLYDLLSSPLEYILVLFLIGHSSIRPASCGRFNQRDRAGLPSDRTTGASSR